jgi:hypothetical protein
MTAWHLSRDHQWKHVIDRETLWILTLSVPVLGSWIFALLLVSQNNAFP